MIIDLFLTYINASIHDKGQLAAFWIAYVTMVDILLGPLRDDKAEDSPFQLSCILGIINWCFALDKIK